MNFDYLGNLTSEIFTAGRTKRIYTSKEFGYPYPGTVNEKLLKYSCGDDKTEIEQFRITEVDLVPDVYIDLKNQGLKIAADYEKETINTTNPPITKKQNTITEPKSNKENN